MFRKSHLLALLGLLSLSTMNASAMECCDVPECNRTYIGGFGGGIYSNSTCMYQMGTAYFDVPLAVYAIGHTKKTSSGFGGVQLGHEWSQCPYNIGCTNWSIAPAVELEAYWYSHRKKGHLINVSGTLEEHDFLDSFDMNLGVYLGNVVLSLNNCCWRSLSPYVGGGVGAARISLTQADSLQTSPPEAGVNHFNSRRKDSAWTFAGQVKVGLRYNFCKSFHIFGEYRYLYVDTSDYIFGSTVYANHVPTSPWNVQIQNIQYNAFVVGLQYDL